MQQKPADNDVPGPSAKTMTPMPLSHFIAAYGELLRADQSVLEVASPLSAKRQSALAGVLADLAATMDNNIPAWVDRQGDAGSSSLESPSVQFGALSLAEGLDISSITGIFQAVRSQAVERWLKQSEPGADSLAQVMRFNEVLDTALSQALARFSNGGERIKNLQLSILGHDLRTPLGALAITSQYLGRPDIPEKKRVDAIARIDRCVGAMNAMVKDVLDYSRSRLGKPIIMQLQTTDLAKLCEYVTDDVRAGYPDVDLRCEPPPSLSIVCDPSRIHHALSNLIVNAIEHGDRRSPILVSTTRNRERATIRVKHFGRVIPQHRMEQVFEPFAQPDAPEGHQDETGYASMGLRLFVARAIVRSHGGDITAQSGPGEETVFSLALPT
jgi:signal transduction histidine kinase